MNADELKQYKVGDKVRITVECQITYMRGGQTQPITVSLGGTIAWPYTEEIIAVERVRPELPDGWKWDGPHAYLGWAPDEPLARCWESGRLTIYNVCNHDLDGADLIAVIKAVREANA